MVCRRQMNIVKNGKDRTTKKFKKQQVTRENDGEESRMKRRKEMKGEEENAE